MASEFAYNTDKKMTEKEEIVFEVLAEGGSLRIIRRKGKSQNIYHYKHQESYFDDEELTVNRKSEFSTFEEPFNLLNTFGWHALYLSRVHKDYQDFVLEQLVAKLNELGVPDSSSLFNLDQLEKALEARITCRKPGGWQFQKLTAPNNQT